MQRKGWDARVGCSPEPLQLAQGWEQLDPGSFHTSACYQQEPEDEGEMVGLSASKWSTISSILHTA